VLLAAGIANGVLVAAEAAGQLAGAGIKGSTMVGGSLVLFSTLLIPRQSSTAQVPPLSAQASSSCKTSAPSCLLHTTSIVRRAPCQSMCLPESSLNRRHDTIDHLLATVNTQCRRRNDQRACSRALVLASTPAHRANTPAVSTTPRQEERQAWICWIT
jgi:hypothetical protein